MADYIQNDTGVCPYCKRRVQASYNKILNLSYRKDLQNKLNDDTLNTFTCLFCDNEFRYETELFAFDLQKKFAIMVNKKDSYENYSHLRSDIYRMVFGDDFKLRFVETCQEMAEKVRLFNLGLDDRVIEIIKQKHFSDIMDNLKEHYRFLVTDITDTELIFTLYDDHDKVVQKHLLKLEMLDNIHMDITNKKSPFAVYEQIDSIWAKEYLNGGKNNE